MKNFAIGLILATSLTGCYIFDYVKWTEYPTLDSQDADLEDSPDMNSDMN